MSDAVLAVWEDRAIEQWRVRWQLPVVVALEHTGSTNDVARRMADEGASPGLLVMTEHQTAGRGRMGRQWTARPGDSLLLSFLLRPAPASGGIAPGTAPVRVGLAVASALRASTGIDAQLKWPNDVIVPGAGKLAGILCEAVSSGADTVIIAGIGINIRQQPDDWPAELREHATSIDAVLGRARGHGVDRTAVMDAIAAAMHPLFTLPMVPLTTPELRAYSEIDALRGRAVTATGQDSAAGVAAGLATDGALRLDTADGLRRVTSATVRTVPNSTSSTRSSR